MLVENCWKSSKMYPRYLPEREGEENETALDLISFKPRAQINRQKSYLIGGSREIRVWRWNCIVNECSLTLGSFRSICIHLTVCSLFFYLAYPHPLSPHPKAFCDQRQSDIFVLSFRTCAKVKLSGETRAFKFSRSNMVATVLLFLLKDAKKCISEKSCRLFQLQFSSNSECVVRAPCLL